MCVKIDADPFGWIAIKWEAALGRMTGMVNVFFHAERWALQASGFPVCFDWKRCTRACPTLLIGAEQNQHTVYVIGSEQNQHTVHVIGSEQNQHTVYVIGSEQNQHTVYVIGSEQNQHTVHVIGSEQNQHTVHVIGSEQNQHTVYVPAAESFSDCHRTTFLFAHLYFQFT